MEATNPRRVASLWQYLQTAAVKNSICGSTAYVVVDRMTTRGVSGYRVSLDHATSIRDNLLQFGLIFRNAMSFLALPEGLAERIIQSATRPI